MSRSIKSRTQHERLRRRRFLAAATAVIVDTDGKIISSYTISLKWRHYRQDHHVTHKYSSCCRQQSWTFNTDERSTLLNVLNSTLLPVCTGPRRREQNRMYLYAAVNLKQNLHSMYSIEATDRHKASRGLSATAGLLFKLYRDTHTYTHLDQMHYIILLACGHDENLVKSQRQT